jgi:hypothetical protein
MAYGDWKSRNPFLKSIAINGYSEICPMDRPLAEGFGVRSFKGIVELTLI